MSDVSDCVNDLKIPTVFYILFLYLFFGLLCSKDEEYIVF